MMQKSTLLSFLLVPLLMAFSFAQAEEAKTAKKIVKWKDEKGVVHYGDVLPPQDAGRGNAVLTQDGVVVRKNDSFKVLSQSDQVTEAVTAEQMRKDSALLASYSSEEEIDLAMERNLQAEQGNLKVLNQRLIEAKKTLAQKQAQLNKVAKEGKPVSGFLSDEVNFYRQKITKTEAEIVVTQNDIQAIKSRYASYKTRYVELRPRDQSLSKINVGKKTLAELERWKAEANQKLSQYLGETVRYKRAGEPIPNHISEGIQQANDEIARAEREIAATKANIKDSQQSFSSR
jgi:peptidoglycan hydrolase CwlO-like protein